jgi:hypothetical protein
MDENSTDKVCLSDVTGTSQRISDGHGSSHRYLLSRVCARRRARLVAARRHQKGAAAPPRSRRELALAAAPISRRPSSSSAHADPTNPSRPPTRPRLAHRLSCCRRTARASRCAASLACRNEERPRRHRARNDPPVPSRRVATRHSADGAQSQRQHSLTILQTNQAKISNMHRTLTSRTYVRITRASSERPKLRSEEPASASPNPSAAPMQVCQHLSQMDQQRVPHHQPPAIGPLSPPVPEQRKRSENVLREITNERLPIGLAISARSLAYARRCDARDRKRR